MTRRFGHSWIIPTYGMYLFTSPRWTAPRSEEVSTCNSIVRAQASSRLDAHIVIREQGTTEDGNIAVARIEKEATSERLQRQKDHICLDPAYKKMKPIYAVPRPGESRGGS